MAQRRERHGRDRSKLCYILYFSGFLDLFGVSMIMPLILPHLRDLGASPTLAGVLGSVYGSLQLMSSPIIGNWSDTVSRQLSLLVCLFLSGCGYAILGLYSSFAVFFVGRVVLGCFKHSQTISKAFLADFIPSQDQSSVLGNFNSFSSTGFIIGPIIGGHLAETNGGFSLVAFLAGLVFIINAVLVWCVVPKDSNADHHMLHASNGLRREDTSTSLKKMNSDEINFSFSRLTKSFRDFDWVELWDLFLIKFLAGFSVVIFRTNFSLVLKQKFEASPKTIGYLTSYSGVIATLSGFVIGGVTNMYNDSAKLFLHSTIFQVISLLCLALSPSLLSIVIFLTPLSLVSSMSRVTATTLTIARSGNSTIGSVMGLSQSVMAVARMAAPFIAGLAQEFAVDGATYISAVAASISVVLMIARPQDPVLRLRQKEAA